MNISPVTSGSVATASGGNSYSSGSVTTASGGGRQAIAQAAETTSATSGSNVGIQAPSSGQVTQAVKQVNEAFAKKAQDLHASIVRDKASGMTIVEIVDKTTREVVGQYPSKAIVAMAAALDHPTGSSGQLMDVSA